MNLRIYVVPVYHDDVIEYKYFSRYWPFMRGSPFTGGFPSQKPVTRNFDVFFDLRLKKRFGKPSRRRRAHNDVTVVWKANELNVLN